MKSGDYIREIATGRLRKIGKECLTHLPPEQLYGGKAYLLHGEGIQKEGLQTSIGWIEQAYIHDKEYKIRLLLSKIDGSVHTG